MSDPLTIVWILGSRGSWLSVDSRFFHSFYVQQFVLTGLWIFCESRAAYSWLGFYASHELHLSCWFSCFLERNRLFPTNMASTHRDSNGVCVFIDLSSRRLASVNASVLAGVKYLLCTCWLSSSPGCGEIKKIDTAEPGGAHTLVLKGDTAAMKYHKDGNNQEQQGRVTWLILIEDVEGKGCGKDSGLSSQRKWCWSSKDDMFPGRRRGIAVSWALIWMSMLSGGREEMGLESKARSICFCRGVLPDSNGMKARVLLPHLGNGYGN